MNDNQLYEMLGVSRTATDAEIKKVSNNRNFYKKKPYHLLITRVNTAISKISQGISS